MRILRQFNDGWVFHPEYSGRHRFQLVSGRQVRLPHNAIEIPLSYFNESVFWKQFCYQSVFQCDAQTLQREVHLIFDASMADTVVFVNGHEVSRHRDGYTPFAARLTGRLAEGENLITVKIDGSENPEIPPFGGYIDYLTYAGIYRDVWLQITDPVWIGDVQILTPEPLSDQKTVQINCRLNGDWGRARRLRAELTDACSELIASAETSAGNGQANLEIGSLSGISLWDIDTPALYRAKLTLDSEDGADQMTVTFGFRSAEFRSDGFWLNGRRLKIRGLNRHQSYPYVGYAMGRRSQERDAEILKHELHCNLVRTSHYPQSPWFLDHCDRIGLLVFEEIPGWQHIGGEEWKAESLANVSRMILRDRNHPCVALWGVRINESADDREFYKKSNELAHVLDPSRQTAGVRCIADSELLEDVYTMNDFVLGSEELPGANHHRIALRDQSDVTGMGRKVPYLVTEFNGHMFPTKTFDNEQRQAEHVLRYLQVLNAACGDPAIAGCIGWCMFDYNTHREFGSGDRICHHGVLDMFRIPKFAASVYASQGNPESNPVLMPVTCWSRGERSIGGVLPLIILTNCDEVEMQIGDGPGQRFAPDRTHFPHLPHAPVIIRSGDFTAGDFGSWGKRWEDLCLTGFLGGQAVAEVRRTNSPVPAAMNVRADDCELLAFEKDEVRVVITALDQTGSRLPYLTDPVRVHVSGAASLIGPNELAFRAGCAAFWIESTGSEGGIEVRVDSPRFAAARMSLNSVAAQTSPDFRQISTEAAALCLEP